MVLPSDSGVIPNFRIAAELMNMLCSEESHTRIGRVVDTESRNARSGICPRPLMSQPQETSVSSGSFSAAEYSKSFAFAAATVFTPGNGGPHGLGSGR